MNAVAAMDRLAREQHFHDAQALRRWAAFHLDPGRLVFADDDYLDHETWLRPALGLLGELRGRAVLDYGCGHGMAAVVLARRGARVTAFDLSPGYLAEVAARARANGVGIDLACADGERLPFTDGAFDAVWGNAVLHHLDLDRAGRELFRVLRPGGLAVFCEAWGENPLLRWARRRLRYPGKSHTADERALRRADLAGLARVFPGLEVRGYQLLSMLRRVLPGGRLTRWLERGDDLLLPRLSWLQRFCRYVVLRLPRPAL